MNRHIDPKEALTPTRDAQVGRDCDEFTRARGTVAPATKPKGPDQQVIPAEPAAEDHIRRGDN